MKGNAYRDLTYQLLFKYTNYYFMLQFNTLFDLVVEAVKALHGNYTVDSLHNYIQVNNGGVIR